MGSAIAERLPSPKATVVVEPKGGPFCDVMTSYNWPVVLEPDEHLNDPNLRKIVGPDEHGAAECGWKP